VGSDPRQIQINDLYLSERHNDDVLFLCDYLDFLCDYLDFLCAFYVMRGNNYVIVQYGPMNLINKQKQALFLCLFLLVSIQKQIKQEKTRKKYLTNKHNAAYD
jgi:hypothetical protein